MKKIDLGQTLTILANLGVVVGILLLVYELSQSRAMMEAQTRATVAQGFNDWIYNVSADQETVNLMSRGDRSEELTDEEAARYLNFKIAQLRYYENVHYQYRMGLYAQEEFSAQREAWRRVTLNNKGTRDFFCSRRPVLVPEFVDEIENLLAEPCD